VTIHTLSLAGLSPEELAPKVLRHPSLLQLSEETLQNKFDQILADAGEEAGRLMVQRRPDVLQGKEGRVGLNLRALQELGASPETAVAALVGNSMLGVLDLEQQQYAARVAFWQQTYNLDSTGKRWCLLGGWDRVINTLRPSTAALCTWFGLLPLQASCCRPGPQPHLHTCSWPLLQMGL